MLFRSPVTQNKAVARRMRGFFRRLPSGLDDPRAVAKEYGQYLWDAGPHRLVDQKKLSRSRFYVGLSVEETGLAELTKRATLISDTLLLTHHRQSPYHELGHGASHPVTFDMADAVSPLATNPYTVHYGMNCPSLESLGRWILASEPLLTAGLAWYLPSFTTKVSRGPEPPRRVEAVDYLIRDGRVVDASGAEPIKGRLVRPVCRMDLPFLDGVGLADFRGCCRSDLEGCVSNGSLDR
ncbi:hypothetical protein, partial [Streptomyces thermospinosisporus]|uniref:hypothetical protein n=1 Tax=Streptomyces thermospinosisporus TaxID=161482 RepID=UPI0031CE2BF3